MDPLASADRATKRATLIVAILGSSIVFLDSTVVGVALPKIGRDLPRHVVGVLEGQFYVYSTYLLSLSSLLILAGAISDHHGRRRMFAAGLAGFGATSALCGLAPSMEVLIAARFLQGAFGAMLVPGSMSLLSVTFTGEEKGRAFGLWAGASAGTTLLGPLVGGVLVDVLTWRAVFLINIPLVVMGLLVIRRVPESRDAESPGHFDWTGAALAAGAVGGLVIAATDAGQLGFGDRTAIVALCVGVASCVVLPVRLRRAANPLVPLELFRSRNFTVINVSTLLIYGALYMTFSYLGLLLQGVLGYSATAAGAAGVPTSILLTLFSARVGRFAGTRDPRLFLTVGPLLQAAGVLWFLRIGVASAAWTLQPGNIATWPPPRGYLVDLLPGILLFAIGLTILVAPLTNALMSSVSATHAGVGSAVNNALSRVGPQLAGAAIFIALTATFFASLGTALPGVNVGDAQVRSQVSAMNVASSSVTVVRAHGGEHFTTGAIRHAFASASIDAFHVAMLVAAALLLCGAAVNFLGLERMASE